MWGIMWGINFLAKKKRPSTGLNLLIIFGGRWATRTPGLWFRRPTLYPPELIARTGNIIKSRLLVKEVWPSQNPDRGQQFPAPSPGGRLARPTLLTLRTPPRQLDSLTRPRKAAQSSFTRPGGSFRPPSPAPQIGSPKPALTHVGRPHPPFTPTT
jgi:hypothetical protein